MTTIKTPDWVKHAVFYQIFPDRFARSPRLDAYRASLQIEPWDTPPTLFGFKGGDLYGIAEHLDTLQDLGITAIYLNPIFASAANHRYHTYDYYQVDPLLGGNQALRFLLDAAHQRGIRIVLDGVFNHASRGFWQFHHVLETGAASPYVNWFHFDPARLHGQRHWGAYPSSQEAEALARGVPAREAIGYAAWWNLPALPKFNTGHPPVRDFIFAVAEHWIRFGIDGWRLDVPAEIDDDSFWQEFRQRVKSINPQAYIVGEIWQRADRWLQGDQFDAVMNYPVGEALLSFFGRRSLNYEEIRRAGYGPRIHPIDGQTLGALLQEATQWYAPAIVQAQMNLFDSHDTPRFLTAVNGDERALALAWLALFTYPGAPTIYYGDEIGLTGGHDPHCRGAFPWDSSRWNQRLRAHLQSLIALRHRFHALRTGDFQLLPTPNADCLAWQRCLDGECLLVFINDSETTSQFTLPTQYRAVRPVWGEGQLHPAHPAHQLLMPPRSGSVLQAWDA